MRFIFTLLLAFVSTCTAAPNTTVSSAIGKIVEAREQAGEAVLQVKSRFHAGDPEYDQSRQLYVTAMAKHSAWIAMVKSAIESGKTKHLPRDAGYQAATSQADEAAQAFLRYTATACGKPRTRGLPAAALGGIGLDIWQGIAGQKQQARAAEAARFERDTRWSRWEAVEAAR